MNAVSDGMNDMVMPYLDDLLIFGPDFETTLARVERLLERLRWAGLSLACPPRS